MTPPDGIQWPRRSTIAVGPVRFVGPFAWLALPFVVVGGAVYAVAQIALDARRRR